MPCLNSSAAHVDLYERVVLTHARGWPEIAGRDDPAALPRLARARARAGRQELSRDARAIPRGQPVHAPDVPASLAFYESLGFVQARVGDAWSHPYAVVTDGRLFLGLHEHDSMRPH